MCYIIHYNLKYNKIHNLILIHKVVSTGIIRPVIIVKIWNVNIYIYVSVCVCQSD